MCFVLANFVVVKCQIVLPFISKLYLVTSCLLLKVCLFNAQAYCRGVLPVIGALLLACLEDYWHGRLPQSDVTHVRMYQNHNYPVSFRCDHNHKV